MKYLVLLLSVITFIFGEEEPTGGVSIDKKLKIVDTSSPGKCNMIVKAGDKIHWKYTGTLTDGTQFDSGGYTATIGKNEVIKGIDVGIRGMCVGGKRKITVHSIWAYGAKGHGNIPGNANLIFDVQLLYIDRPNVAMETYEAKIRRKGRVSTENKLKIEDTFKVDPESCKLQSRMHDTIYWNYRGYLLNGVIFDTGKFWTTIGHHGVITGVDIGMRGLCVGDKRTMTIHPSWGYGRQGRPPKIPPNSVLKFDVELTGIKRPDGQTASIDELHATHLPAWAIPPDKKIKAWRRLHPAF